MHNASLILLLGYYKEYVASLIGLYKNNGAVWYVPINNNIHHKTLTDCGDTNRLWLYSDSELDEIYSWAIMNRKCNTFFGAKFI